MRAGRTDEGFTLIETMVVVAIMGVGSTLAVSGFSSYADSAEHSGTRDSVVSALRAANQRALAEAAAYCVRFAGDGKSWTTHRGTCDTAVLKGPEPVGGDQVSLTNVSFGTAGSRDVEFTARGTASAGALKVVREGSSTTYTVTVEGLTARVSAS